MLKSIVPIMHYILGGKMSFIRYKNVNGRMYAYEITAYWDAKLQKSRQKSEYLGAIDNIGDKPRKKEIIQKLQLDFGDGYLLHKFIAKLDFYEVIQDTFVEKFPGFLPLICYRLCMQSAMYNAENWLDGNITRVLFANIKLSSQDISYMLKKLGNESIQRAFLTKYLAKIKKSSRAILIDATSLPNSSDVVFNSWGHNDNGMTKQLRMLCVVDQNDGQPLFYRALPGNMLDMSTLQNTMAELKEMDLSCSFVLLDAGYFSEDNTHELYKQNIHFLTRMQKSRLIYKELVNEKLSDIETVQYATASGKRGIFAKRVEIELYTHKAYAYIVLDPVRKGKEMQELLIEYGQDPKSSITQSDLSNCGIVIFISSLKLDSKEVVSHYYTRMQVEQVFSFCKSDLQLLPLRKHSEETMSGYLFLQFIILIIFIHLRNAIVDEYTVEQALLIARNIKCKIVGKDVLIAEFTKKQKEIYKLCGIEIPKSCKVALNQM